MRPLATDDEPDVRLVASTSSSSNASLESYVDDGDDDDVGGGGATSSAVRVRSAPHFMTSALRRLRVSMRAC